MADGNAGTVSRKPQGPHRANRLTAKSLPKTPGRHADGDGLYLVVDPSGARRWVLRVLAQGRRRDIGLGGLSWVSLAEAREEARRLRKVARSGGDPLLARERERLGGMTFEEAARAVHAEHVAPTAKNGKHVGQWLSSLEIDVFPVIGERPVATVIQADVVKALAPVWLAKPETARRLRQRIRSVLDWARGRGLGDGPHPCEGIERALPRQPDKPEHHAAVPWRDLPDLWPRLAAAPGMGSAALRFTILTAARSGETRGATWDEIDLAARVWTIPASRMKAGTAHRVPLSDAALAVLEEAAKATGRRKGLVFPARDLARPLSDMTLAAVLKRLEVPATVHGFRSTFRDWAEEAANYPHEVKESALAHVVKSKTERAYRRTDHLEARGPMMAAWAGFVTGRGATVIPIASAARA